MERQSQKSFRERFPEADGDPDLGAEEVYSMAWLDAIQWHVETQFDCDGWWKNMWADIGSTERSRVLDEVMDILKAQPVDGSSGIRMISIADLGADLERLKS